MCKIKKLYNAFAVSCVTSLTLLLCLVLIHTKSKAQVTQTSWTKNIGALFKGFDNMQSPGYAIGIIKGDKMLYFSNLFRYNNGRSILTNLQFLFDITSVSKQFTAAYCFDYNGWKKMFWLITIAINVPILKKLI